MRKKKRRIILLFSVTILLIIILGCYLLVSVNARGKTFDDVQDMPFNEVGLLLGTSPLLPMANTIITLMKESKLLQCFAVVEKSKEL